MDEQDKFPLPTFDSPRGRRLEAVLNACDQCGKPLTKDELAKVDLALPIIAANKLLILECAACTQSRDCSDEEYFTDLKAVGDQALANALKR